MATVTVDYLSLPTDLVGRANACDEHDSATQSSANRPQMHRIRTVRIQQGVSLRTAARQMKSTVSKVRAQEEETTDLKLSDLHKWQKALDVPVTELLVEPDNSTLSPPILERARLLRMMKTAVTILENAPNDGIERLAENLVNNLIEVMPELEDVAPWHTYGQRRSLDEVGRAAEQPVPTDFLSIADFD